MAAAAQGDYATVVRLAGSGVWQAGDGAAALAALLGAASLHDVHCRRAIGAALLGRETRSRRLMRSAALADAYARCVADGTVGLAEALRLSRMGGASVAWLLAQTALRFSPEWGGELLRKVASRVPHARLEEAVDLALCGARPGMLLRALLELRLTTAQRVLERRPDAAENAALLEGLAEDGGGDALRELAWRFVPHVLRQACRTGSETLVSAIEAHAHPIEPRLRDEAVRLCKQHDCAHHLVERVAALRVCPDFNALLGLAGAPAGLTQAYARNYNVLRIMSGLGGLTYTS